MRTATLVFPIRSNETNALIEVLLGLKKRGFGMHKWNGFGGKVGEESVRDAAVRELEEECGLHADPYDLIAMGVLEFPFLDREKWSMRVHVFLVERFTGEPVESEEMEPRWFSSDSIPYASMWEDDRHWLPYVLERRAVNGAFAFRNDRIVRIDLTIGKQV
jgi:8-oxo-dGTP pyrophosphatase MutT (NUDIX family)